MGMTVRKPNGNGETLPPAPKLPEVEPVQPETEEQVLARYGKTADQIPAVMLAAADATRLAGEKLVEESAAGVAAAEDILKMLKEEHEVFVSEVRRHSSNMAVRLTEYLTRCHTQRQAMADHRESIIGVAQAVANEPAAMTLKSTDEVDHGGATTQIG